MLWDASTFAQWMEEDAWPEVTNLEAWGDDEVIEHLAKDPMARGHHLQCSIPRWEPYTPHQAFPEHRISLGILDGLPYEIVDYTLGFLDICSLQSFSRTCHYALFTSTHQSEYQLIQKLAPPICPLLHLTGLAYLHPVTSIARELRFPGCRSCGVRGTLLCLTTCERLCENCAELNQSYWGLLLSEAKHAFALSDLDLDDAPILITNGRVWRGSENELTQSEMELVAVKSALFAALRKWGSRQATIDAAEIISRDRYADASAAEISNAQLYRYLRGTRLGPLDGDPSQVTERIPNLPSTDRLGILTTLFPTVPPGWSRMLPTFRCSGCWIICNAPFQMTNENYQYCGIGAGSTVEDKARIVKGRTLIVRTVDELRRHIQHECLGAKLLMFRRFKLLRDGEVEDLQIPDDGI